MYEPLNSDNFIRIAMHMYDNPQCTSLAEFEEDIKRFSYLKKLFGRYKDQNVLKERLILNHLIILHNVFGTSLPEFLFFKIDNVHWSLLTTFLVFLNIMPNEIPEFGIKASDIPLDENVANVLRQL